jgi:uncharacterized membrane-anchored protein
MAILQATTSSSHELLSKVPQVTALFWLTKIFATRFGETAGDAVSMSLNLGYLISTFILVVILGCVSWSKHKHTRLNPT